MSRLFDRYPSSVFWCVIVGYGALFGEIFLTLLPHGIARSALLVAGASFTAVPGLVVFTNAAGSVQRLRAEFRRRGYSGRTVNWPDYYWRTFGLGLSVIGAAGIFGGLTT